MDSQTHIPAISVIVPVYNAEKYLRRCVDSILGQTFTDFELLLINDGSTDSSGAICDEYAVKDERVRVFHKPNAGVSSARNLGLDKARGEWITFIDSDDYIDEEFISNLSSQKECDLAIGDFRIVEAINNFDNCHIPKGLYSSIEIGKIFLKYLFINFTTPWAKLFKKSIIEKMGLRFDLELIKGEDTIFVFQYLRGISSLASTGCDYCYHYRLASTGLHAQYDLKSYMAFIQRFVDCFSELGQRFNLTEDEFYPHYFRGNISYIFPYNFAYMPHSEVRKTVTIFKANKAMSHLFDVLERNNCGKKAKVFFKLYHHELIYPLMVWMRLCKLGKKKFA